MLDYRFGKRSTPPCGDCDEEGYCTMNCGPAIPAPKLPEGFKVICSVCGDTLEASIHFSKGQLKKKHPRCRTCAPNKFSNRKTETGHQSVKESKRAQYLKTLLAAGLITNLREQVNFELIPAQRDEAGKLIEKACVYRADFVYNDDQGALHVEDAKGMRTDVYKIKRKLMLSVHKIRIEEV